MENVNAGRHCFNRGRGGRAWLHPRGNAYTMGMTRHRKFAVALFVIFIGALVAAYLGWGESLTSDSINEHKKELQEYVERNYPASVFLFIGVLMTTAFFVPGVLLFAMVGGFLFGTLRAVLFVDIGITAGACLAFLTARYLLGTRLQEKFASRLSAFNREIEHHGSKYLLVLRIIPMLPFFVVNYLAGLTAMPLKRFAVLTFFGVIPGALVLAYTGEQLGSVASAHDVMSPRIWVAFGAMALLIMLPVITAHWKRRSG